MTTPTAITYYRQGELAVLQGTFTNPASTIAPVDPVTGNTLIDPAGWIKFTYTDPNGNQVTKTVGTDAVATKVSTGVYQCTVDLAAAIGGLWKYRCYSQAGLAGQAAEEYAFYVQQTTV